MEQRYPDQPRTVVIGRDTRASGQEIEQTLLEGLSLRDNMTFSLGVVPTPAVAMAVGHMHAQIGIVITASHNPAEYNGIKLFNAQGMKLPESEELAIEQLVDKARPPQDRQVGVNKYEEPFEDYYVNFIRSLMHKGCLTGWRIALDTANGATTSTTERVLRHHGAEIIAMGNKPDGTNINAAVGSEHPEAVAALVRKHGAQLGVAHDGDGDRLILVDEQGSVVDGDQVLGMLALDALSRGKLVKQTLVTTIHSNMGLDKAVNEAGGQVLRAPVGDRNVLYAMLENGLTFGGESSGHIICLESATTGDGLVALVKVLDLMLRTHQPLSQLRKQVALFPSATRNILVREKLPLDNLDALQQAIGCVNASLSGEGQCLVRFSGTEPKIRLRVEAPTQEQAQECLQLLEKAVHTDLDVVA